MKIMLYDQSKGLYLNEVKDGDCIDFSTLPSLTTFGCDLISSNTTVFFQIDGTNIYKSKYGDPFYLAWPTPLGLSLGTYTLTVIVPNQPQIRLHFTVTNTTTSDRPILPAKPKFNKVFQVSNPNLTNFQLQSGYQYNFIPQAYTIVGHALNIPDDVELNFLGGHLDFVAATEWDKAFATQGSRIRITGLNTVLHNPLGHAAADSTVSAVSVHGNDVTLENFTTEGGRSAHISNATRVLINNFRQNSPPDYHGYIDPGTDITIQNSVVTGKSLVAHIWRFYRVLRIAFINCQYHNASILGASWNGEVLNARDCKHCFLDNCLLDGPNVIGPRPVVAEQSLIVDDIQLTNCTLTDYLMLYSGVTNLKIRKSILNAWNSGSCVSVKPSYNAKPVVQGEITDSSLNYPNKNATAFAANWRGNLNCVNDTFNSKPL